MCKVQAYYHTKSTFTQEACECRCAYDVKGLKIRCFVQTVQKSFNCGHYFVSLTSGFSLSLNLFFHPP